MKVKFAILILLVPFAVASWQPGFPIDDSVWHFNNAYGVSVCPAPYSSVNVTNYPTPCLGPYPGGFYNDPNVSHVFYYGVDCFVTEGQPAFVLGTFINGSFSLAFFIYMVTVLRKQVGWSPYLRDFSVFFFWQVPASWGATLWSGMAYIGSQYENVADVPGWVYFWGSHALGLEYVPDGANGWLQFVLCLRLIFEPCCRRCCPKIPMGYLWAILHVVPLYFYMFPTQLMTHFCYGTNSGIIVAQIGMSRQLGHLICLLYSIVRCNPYTFLNASLSFVTLFVAWPVISWQYFDDFSFLPIYWGTRDIAFFLGVLYAFRNHIPKPEMESKARPLLM